MLDAEAGHGRRQPHLLRPEGVLGVGQSDGVEKRRGHGHVLGLALLEASVVEVVEEQPDVRHRGHQLQMKDSENSGRSQTVRSKNYFFLELKNQKILAKLHNYFERKKKLESFVLKIITL